MEGLSEAAITTDTGAAPEGGCTGSTEGGAAHAGDAGDAPAGIGGAAEVRLVLLHTLGTSRPYPEEQWEAHDTLGSYPI